jgi:hypothetical protein
LNLIQALRRWRPAIKQVIGGVSNWKEYKRIKYHRGHRLRNIELQNKSHVMFTAILIANEKGQREIYEIRHCMLSVSSDGI